MFFQTTDTRELDVDALLAPYLHLDKSLFKGEDDGLACRKKFSNNGNGVSLQVRMLLKQTATAIRKEHFKPENWLGYVDVFTLYSNHLDQHLFDVVNERLEVKEKEALVLDYLEAAFSLSPTYDYLNLQQYSARELSSHAQLMHYLGKARRYVGIGIEERLPLVTQALAIAEHLNALSCSEADDPHAYRGRVSTYKMPVNYGLQELKRFKEAADLLKPELESSDPFIVTQMHVQLAKIYILEAKHQGTPFDKAFFHAHQAVEVSQTQDNKLISYNARVCLMDTCQAAGESEKANEIAETIIAEMDSNSDCGAKPLHRDAANKVLEANRSALGARCN